jgi:hypothetical protein
MAGLMEMRNAYKVGTVAQHRCHKSLLVNADGFRMLCMRWCVRLPGLCYGSWCCVTLDFVDIIKNNAGHTQQRGLDRTDGDAQCIKGETCAHNSSGKSWR